MDVKRLVISLVIGVCFGVLGYIIFQKVFAGFFLGVVWFIAMMTGKKNN